MRGKVTTFVDLLLYAVQSDERGRFGRYTPNTDQAPTDDRPRRSTASPTQPQFPGPAADPCGDPGRAAHVNAIAAIPATTTTAPTTRDAGTRSCANSAAAAVAITTLVSRRAATGAASAISSAASATA